MIAEGSRISGVGRIKGYKDDTVSARIRDAAEHAEAVEDILLSEFLISRVQYSGTRLKAVCGDLRELVGLLGKSTAYVERIHPTMRTHIQQSPEPEKYRLFKRNSYT